MVVSFCMSSGSDNWDTKVSTDLLRELVCGVPMPDKLDLLSYGNPDVVAPNGVLLIDSWSEECVSFKNVYCYGGMQI